MISWDKSQYERAGWDQGHGRHPPGSVCSVNLSTLSCLDPVQSVTSSIQKQVLRQVKWPRMTDASSITHIVRPLHVTFPSLLMTPCVNNWVCSLFVINVQGLKDTKTTEESSDKSFRCFGSFLYIYALNRLHAHICTHRTYRKILFVLTCTTHSWNVFMNNNFLNETNPPVVTFNWWRQSSISSLPEALIAWTCLCSTDMLLMPISLLRVLANSINIHYYGR